MFTAENIWQTRKAVKIGKSGLTTRGKFRKSWSAEWKLKIEPKNVINPLEASCVGRM